MNDINISNALRHFNSAVIPPTLVSYRAKDIWKRNAEEADFNSLRDCSNA